MSRDISRGHVNYLCWDNNRLILNLPIARLQAPDAVPDKKPDLQESDITSQEASIHTPSPRRNGSVTNFQSPVHRGNSIHTITQSASRTDLNRGSIRGSVRSPAVTVLPKRRLEHVLNRSLLCCIVSILSFNHHWIYNTQNLRLIHKFKKKRTNRDCIASSICNIW